MSSSLPPSISQDLSQDLPHGASAPEMRALHRLLEVAMRDTGQSRRVADFLLAWWNAPECGGFDLTDLWAVDTELAHDMLRVLGLIARTREYPPAFGLRDAFVQLVRLWRSKPTSD